MFFGGLIAKGSEPLLVTQEVLEKERVLRHGRLEERMREKIRGED